MSRGEVAISLSAVVIAGALCASVYCAEQPSEPHLSKGNNTKPPSVEELIQKFGYSVETHEVRTEDGYLLTHHRIPHGKTPGGNRGRRPPVLIKHGLLCCSGAFVLTPEGLGFVMADAGFDVWLLNSRGNSYSRKHVKYDPDKDKKKFWDFSWHEMGFYDLAADIDYVLKVTGHDQLFYIGHSMGTTSFSVLGATRPEYMRKVRASAILGLFVSPWNVKSKLAKRIDRVAPRLSWITSSSQEVLPVRINIKTFMNFACRWKQTESWCKYFIFLLTGFNDKGLNMKLVDTLLKYMPAGTSKKTFQHIHQMSKKDIDFRQFDYGEQVNQKIYGSPSPPVYNLTKVTAPLYMYYGMNDWISTPKDVIYVAGKFPNVKKLEKVADDKFNHIDFMWGGANAKTLLYDDIISIFQKLANEEYQDTINT